MNALTQQKAICDRFCADFMAVEPTDKVGIALETLGTLPLNALRLNPEKGTCGWYIWGGESSTAPDFFKPLHVAHLAERCSDMIKYLGLPPGWRVQLARGHEDVWLDDELLK